MKRFIIGFLSGALIFGSLTAFAASGKMIEVFYTVKDIKINQISKMPKEEQLKPFIHKGTTFVPLRYISENLGYPVVWDGKTNTVVIGETGEETAVYPGNGIESMNFQKGSWHDYTYKYNSSRTVVDNIGNQYSNYLTFSVSSGSKEENWCELEFPLMGEYKKFISTIGLLDTSKNTVLTFNVAFILDGNSVYSTTVKAGDFPEEISFDTTNAQKMTIRVTADSRNLFSTGIGLFNARFIK